MKLLRYLAIAGAAVALSTPVFSDAIAANASGASKSRATSSAAKSKATSGAAKSKATSSAAKSKANSKR